MRSVITMLLLMIYLQELQNIHVRSKEEISKTKRLFESPIFDNNRDFYTFN